MHHLIYCQKAPFSLIVEGRGHEVKNPANLIILKICLHLKGGSVNLLKAEYLLQSNFFYFAKFFQFFKINHLFIRHN